MKELTIEDRNRLGKEVDRLKRDLTHKQEVIAELNTWLTNKNNKITLLYADNRSQSEKITHLTAKLEEEKERSQGLKCCGNCDSYLKSSCIKKKKVYTFPKAYYMDDWTFHYPNGDKKFECWHRN
jgi:predicted  nucleic acid-binding Zn-ribbon protein